MPAILRATRARRRSLMFGCPHSWTAGAGSLSGWSPSAMIPGRLSKWVMQ